MKTYLVTGVTSGMGGAIYRHLTGQGHKVVVVLRDKAKVVDLPVAPYAVIEADFDDVDGTGVGRGGRHAGLR